MKIDRIRKGDSLTWEEEFSLGIAHRLPCWIGLTSVTGSFSLSLSLDHERNHLISHVSSLFSPHCFPGCGEVLRSGLLDVFQAVGPDHCSSSLVVA